jgi:NADH-quinone oxidoreductase subunit L
MAATIGLAQFDIKRVLAYSTVSQLGYMFTAMGVGAFSAGVFHLMTHAFFKALLFLGSGSVIHAMAGEQDMRRMGGLKRYMPVTFVTMLIGTLAIAGIFPFAGFFSKDEILFRAFVANKPIWMLAVVTALLTAFYMTRLVSMTFFGPYRGPAWEAAEPVAHGVAIAADHATHGLLEARGDRPVAAGHAVLASGSGTPAGSGGPADHVHGAWHGPHESPQAMTFPLRVLAVGAVIAGFVGVPPALGGGNAIERFLEPSFTAEMVHADPDTVSSVGGTPVEARGPETDPAPEHTAPVSRGVEVLLMVFSLVIALGGIGLAAESYVIHPQRSVEFADRFAGARQVLLNKYYVDELYDATIVAGTMGSARALWTVDRNVVDGAVNGTGWATIIGSWFSGLTDKAVVDGLVNLVGRIVEESSHLFRRLQTGLVQNYALLILFGVFAFITVYLFAR